jgi:transcriptional regulator with PAS, ATPase and Fis domain
MPAISKQKRDKISEQILHYLFTISPTSEFTNKISSEIARDEEFVKSILQELERNKLVISVDKNAKGINYSRRLRWTLSPQAYDVYKRHQQTIRSRVTPQNSNSFEETEN